MLRAFACAVLIATAAGHARACPIEDAVSVYPSGGSGETRLPSNPTLYFTDPVATFEVESRGKPVPFQVLPTKVPYLQRLIIHLDEGPLLIRTYGGQDVGYEHYQVEPGEVSRDARITVLARGPDWFQLGGAATRALAIEINSEAGYYRVDWSDGHQTISWGYVDIDRFPTPGLRYKIVAMFPDGSEAVVFEAPLRGPGSVDDPAPLDDPGRPWLAGLWALGLLALSRGFAARCRPAL
jgi:hypothetical protein